MPYTDFIGHIRARLFLDYIKANDRTLRVVEMKTEYPYLSLIKMCSESFQFDEVRATFRKFNTDRGKNKPLRMESIGIDIR